MGEAEADAGSLSPYKLAGSPPFFLTSPSPFPSQGTATKVSRLHAFLKLRPADGTWWIRNVGRKTLSVNSVPVEVGKKRCEPWGREGQGI